MKCPAGRRSPTGGRRSWRDLGFAPLVHRRGRPRRPSSASSPPRSQRPTTRTKPRPTPPGLRASLPTSRRVALAHYLNAMIRDKIGGYNVQVRGRSLPERLGSTTTWVQRSVSMEVRASRPLKEARSMWWGSGKARAYRAVAFLRPAFPADELSVYSAWLRIFRLLCLNHRLIAGDRGRGPLCSLLRPEAGHSVRFQEPL